MNDTLTLGLALLISSALSVGTSLVIRFRFADIIHDEAGLRLLIGQGTWPHKPPRFLAVVFTAIAFVLAWLAAFITPVVFGDELGTLFPVSALSLLAGATGWLFWIDSRIHRLPDRLVLPLGAAMFLVTAVGLVVGYFETVKAAQTAGIRGLIGAVIVVAVFGVLNLVAYVGRWDTVGLGDVKLGALIGLAVGMVSLWGLIVVLAVANASALVYWINTKFIKRAKVTHIAFGPHLLIGTWTAVLLTPLAL